MIDYRIVVKDLAGNTLGEFDRYTNLRFQKVLNKEGDCSFDIDISDEKATSTFIAPGLREVYIMRNNQTVWGGVMWHYNGKIPTVDNTITIQCVGFLRWLQKACVYVKQSYTSDAGALCWTLIDNYQSLPFGNRGITMGSIPTTFDVIEDVEYSTVYDEIAKLSQISPRFDYEITQTKVFNIYSPSQGADKSASLIYDLTQNDSKNIHELDFSEDFDNIANEVLEQGAGNGDAMATALVDNTDLQASYGLLQKIVPAKSESNTDILTGLGENEIAINGKPRQQYNIINNPSSEPDYTELDLGDSVLVRAVKGNFVNLYSVARISALEVTFDQGIEYVKPTYQYGSI